MYNSGSSASGSSRSGFFKTLRPWLKPRIVELYTFVPPITGGVLQNLGIAKRWKKLTERHNQSQKILDLPVLSIQEEEEIDLASVASKVTIQSGELDLDALVDQNISSYYQHQHASRLHSNRNYARKIADDIITAKVYPGRTALIYVLFKYNNKYEWAIYEPKSKSLRNIEVVKLLDWLQCNSDTECAIVNANLIEELSDHCIQNWCNKCGANRDNIISVCKVYLMPEQKRNELKNIA